LSASKHHLLKSHDWKSGSSVKVIATITQSQYWRPGQKHENETVEYLMTELQSEGEMVKKMDAKKFYAVYYQMTELIPLFSYLERLNALKYTVLGFEESIT